MEDFEKVALSRVAFKATCWFHYMDVVTWPHGPEELSNFFNHLIIQFTMETEQNGYLPFLDVGINRRSDGFLGHRVYRKPTHTNLYLNAELYHNPANKPSMLLSLVHRARAICNQTSLPGELEFLYSMLKQNGYNDMEIHCTLQGGHT
jgi:hypothetical protein